LPLVLTASFLISYAPNPHRVPHIRVKPSASEVAQPIVSLSRV
jgi:hypothetical protein